jgi:hypothetical protein
MFDRKDPSVCLLLDSGDRRLKKLSGLFPMEARQKHGHHALHEVVGQARQIIDRF